MSEHTISTHVLDTVHGGAAVGVSVSLYRRSSEGWLCIASGETGQDGRCSSLLTPGPFVGGTYKLTFATGAYFKSKDSYCIFPTVDVVFECNAAEKYHVPLLISSYGYSTYRGT